MHRILIILIAVLVISVSSCIQPTVRRSELIDYPVNPGIVIKQPPADKANVIFLRPNISGNLYSTAIYDGERFISL